MFEKYLVETLGTALFVYIVLATGNPLAIGATLVLVIMLTSKVSGGHINPAVTMTLASAGKLRMDEVLPYCVSQVLGGLLALEVYKRYKLLA